MMYFISVLMIFTITVCFVLFACGAEDKSNVEFLESYGWIVDSRCVDNCDILIPKPFDRVYENYNKLQIKAGLDLVPYMGMSGRRYTYIVKNYPVNVGEEVRANVICVGEKQVAGDIMTVSSNGFIHSLNFSDALQ